MAVKRHPEGKQVRSSTTGKFLKARALRKQGAVVKSYTRARTTTETPFPNQLFWPLPALGAAPT